MNINDIIDTESLPDKIEGLKSGRNKPLPDITAIKKQWNVTTHKTMVDKIMLPDKTVKRESGTIVQPVNRIALPFQKTIVNKAVSFAFGIPVALNADPEGDSEETIFEAVKAVTKDAKLNAFSRTAYRELLRATEFAELWHTVKKDQHDLYGFSTDLKVRVSGFRPFDGDKLFPYFDETGDMIAFSREFIRYNEKNQPITYFETYTDEYKYLWRQDGTKWVEVDKPAAHGIGKIPVAYCTQDAVEWEDVQNLIERLELLLSRFAETNDYHGSPALFFTGESLTMPDKGEAGKVWQGSEGSDVKMISWDSAPEAIKLEIETDLRFIYSLTQTPDVSFDSVKGLSAISGVALEMLFMDAHLKVQEKKEILDDFLQRRVNIIKAMIGKLSGLSSAADSLEIEPEIIPYKINDETTTISNLMSASAGKPIISRKTAVKTLGWADDVDAEISALEEEEAAAISRTSFSDPFDE